MVSGEMTSNVEHRSPTLPGPCKFTTLFLGLSGSFRGSLLRGPIQHMAPEYSLAASGSQECKLDAVNEQLVLTKPHKGIAMENLDFGKIPYPSFPFVARKLRLPVGYIRPRGLQSRMGLVHRSSDAKTELVTLQDTAPSTVSPGL